MEKSFSPSAPERTGGNIPPQEHTENSHENNSNVARILSKAGEYAKRVGKKILPYAIGALPILSHAENQDATPSRSDTLYAKVETGKDDSVKRATTDSVENKEDTIPTKKAKLKVYTKAKTLEGGITPSGYSNSFLENEYGVTPADLEYIAQELDFSTESEAAFQKNMIEYVHANYPEIIDTVLSKYKQTRLGLASDLADYRGLEDGVIGVRDAFVIYRLKQELQKKAKTAKREDKKVSLERKNVGGKPNLEGYDKLYLLLDVSPSMQHYFPEIAKELRESAYDMPVEISGFTDKINFTQKTSNMEQAAQIVNKMKPENVDKEYTINAFIEKLRLIENTPDKKIILEITDEDFQNVTKEKIGIIRTLCAEKNATVFIQFQLKNGEHRLLDIEQIEKKYEKAFVNRTEEKAKPLRYIIENRTKMIDARMKEIARLTKNDSVTLHGEDKKRADELLQEIESFKKERNDKQAELDRVLENTTIGYTDIVSLDDE